jgi:PAS domain-containing protein
VNKWRVALASGEPLELEARHRRADGKYRWYLVRQVPLRDDKGDIVKWYGTLHDIDDRIQVEMALRKSEERNRILLQINNVIITNLTQQALLHSISEALHPVFPFDRCAITLYQPERDSFRFLRGFKQFRKTIDVRGTRVANHEIAKPALTPCFHVER